MILNPRLPGGFYCGVEGEKQREKRKKVIEFFFPSLCIHPLVPRVSFDIKYYREKEKKEIEQMKTSIQHEKKRRQIQMITENFG